MKSFFNSLLEQIMDSTWEIIEVFSKIFITGFFYLISFLPIPVILTFLTFVISKSFKLIIDVTIINYFYIFLGWEVIWLLVNILILLIKKK